MTSELPLKISPHSFRWNVGLQGLILCSVTVLSGCSVDLEPTPTPTATPTAITFGPGDVAVGTLLDRSRESWSDVSLWTSETRIDGPDESEGSGTESVTTEHIEPPNNRRVLTMNGETIASEEIVVGGTVYMRGTLVPASIYPSVDQSTWIAFDPAVVPADTPLKQRVDYLTSPPRFPFADVTAETRSLPASPMGDIQVKGRNCAVYSFTSVSEGDNAIHYRIAFDGENRPCQLSKEGGGVVDTTTWTYDDSAISIAPPPDSERVDEFPSGP